MAATGRDTVWTFRTVAKTDHVALAPFIARHGACCLHAAQGTSVEAHAAELAALPVDEACFIVAERDGAVDGCIGAELDAVARRAWVRGPLVRDLPPAVAATLRGRLLDELLRALPAARRFDAFPAIGATALIAADQAAGFQPRTPYHVMRLAEPAPARLRRADIVAGDADHLLLPQVLSLHDALFPQTYLPGAALAATLDDNHALFIAGDGEAAAGYVYLQHKQPENAGTIDFLGVDPAARRGGIGAALLDTAVDWALRQRRLPHVDLTVDQANTAALGLYRNAGFREVSAGLHLVLER